MSAHPLVSVVTIFLNAERFFQDALDSVFAQSYTNWELILVDDGSTDGSTSLALDLARQHPERVRYLEHDRHANRGMSASRNAGIRAARGAYVAFLDSDDLWFPNKLERQVAILDANPRAAMVYGATEYWSGWTGAPEDLARDYRPDLGVALDTIHEPPSLMTKLYPLGTSTAPSPSDLLVRRAALDEIGLFEESFTGMYEDQAFLAKVYLTAPVFVSSETWDRYRLHPESCMAASQRERQYDNVRKFFLHWLQVYLHRQRVTEPAVWNALRRALDVSGADVEARRRRTWQLRTAGGSIADLAFSPQNPDGVRVVIDRAASGTSYDIQLNRPRIGVRANHRYAVSFRARADAPRSFLAGFAEAHDPWNGLGWHDRISVTTEWTSFSAEFVVPHDDANARIHFDLGEENGSVEFSDVLLRELPGGDVVEPGVGDGPTAEHFGTLRQLEPISRKWGFDRGTPVDRHYIESFLASQAAHIRGRVMEIEDDMYTRKFGRDQVTHADILHVTAGNPKATLIGDLTTADHLPSNAFDCIVLTQTLQFIYDTRAALRTLHRMLKPGGVLLATFPGLSKVSLDEWAGSWFWGFTSASARRLFAEAFPNGAVEIRAVGNVLTTIAFMHGLAAEELDQHELDHVDPEYELLLTVQAVKARE